MIHSYGSLSEGGGGAFTAQPPPRNDPVTMDPTTTTTTTTAPLLVVPNHERRSTNTDIASIFHLMRTTVGSGSSVVNDQHDDDDDDSPPLLPLASRSDTTNTRSGGCCGRRRRRLDDNHHSNHHHSHHPSMIPTMGATLNLCNATLGAGILALPYTLLQAGFIYGSGLLGLAALATERSIYILMAVLHDVRARAANHPNSSHCHSYESLVQQVLDQPPTSASSSPLTTTTRRFYSITYRRTIEIAMLFFCCGCAIGYIMAIMDILEEFHLLFVYQSRHYTIMVVWLLAMVPLSLLRSVQSLQYASAVGIMAIGTLIVAAFVHYRQNHDYHHSQPDRSPLESPNVSVLLQLLSRWRRTLDSTNHNDDSDETPVSLMDFLWPANGWLSILTSGPVVLFAFSCQPNVFSIYEELIVDDEDEDDMNHRSTENGTLETNHRTSSKKLRVMHGVTIVAVCICVILYCSISVIALADFGKNVQPNMLSCYNSNNNTGGGSSTLIQIATAAMALAIVMAFPLNIFPARVTLIGLWYHYCRQRQQAAESSISLHGIIPHGGLTAALLDDEDDLDQRLELAVNVEPHNNNALVSTVDVSVSAANGNHREMEYRDNGHTADHEPPFNRTVHVVSTLCLTTSTLVLAMILPNISVVFGLLGGTASSWLGFCVPGLLGIQLSQNDHANGHPPRCGLLFTSWALLIGGVVVGVLTTGVTIYNTIIH